MPSNFFPTHITINRQDGLEIVEIKAYERERRRRVAVEMAKPMREMGMEGLIQVSNHLTQNL